MKLKCDNCRYKKMCMRRYNPIGDRYSHTHDCEHYEEYEQRPHGEWVIRGDNTFITCNKCGYVKGVNCIYFRTRFEPLPNFCENCGADMRREPAP